MIKCYFSIIYKAFFTIMNGIFYNSKNSKILVKVTLNYDDKFFK